MRLTSATVVWWHSGLLPVSIRWAPVSAPDGKFERRAWFVQRWQLEVTFEDAQAHPGVETQR